MPRVSLGAPTAAKRLRRFLPQRLAAHRILTGPNKGLRMVASWHDYPGAIIGYTEGAMLTWLDANVRSGETWLDIGAHYGYVSLRLAALVGPEGRVFAFEPSLSSAGALAQTRRINDLKQITVVPLGLADEPGLTAITLPEIRGMIDSTIDVADAEFFETILATGFAELWPRLSGGDGKVDGIKIDVQGMELHVLRGLRPVLEEHRPALLLELHSGVDREEILSELTALGYSRNATAIDPADGETSPQFLDDRTYLFSAAAA